MGRKILDAACLLMLVLASCVLVLFVYDTVSVQQYNVVWDMKSRALFLYTKQANQRYEISMRRAVAMAQGRGFAVIPPRMVQTNRLFDVWYPRWNHSNWMSFDGRLLLIDHRFVGPVPDDDLDCMMAHELGHVIDFQSHRQGHSVFWPIRCLDRERFADEIGYLLCGADRYARVFQRYIKFRPPAISPCDVQ